MRLGSRQAYRSALANWDALVNDIGQGERAFARELFAVADMIAHSPALAGALDDTARSPEDRARLASQVLGAHVSGEISDLVQGLAREAWSEEGDLGRAIEALGVQTLLAGAQREKSLDRLETELYSLRALLISNRDLYNALRDSIYPLDRRQNLAARILCDATVYAQELLKRAIEKSATVSIEDSLSEYIDIVAERCEHVVASVQAAVPLSAEQENRLADILARIYGKDVRIHTDINPALIGGVKVAIGNDVIDGTIATKLDNVKKVFNNRR